jgi:hypothetical protein
MSDKVKMVIGLELENGEKMLLDEETAKELYQKLKKVFEEKNPQYVFVPSPYPVYVNPQPVFITIQPSQPWPTWYTSWINTAGVSSGGSGNLTITNGTVSMSGGGGIGASVSASYSTY